MDRGETQVPIMAQFRPPMTDWFRLLNFLSGLESKILQGTSPSAISSKQTSSTKVGKDHNLRLTVLHLRYLM